MTVSVDGQPLYRWPVSTGATGFSTPDGSYTPFRMEVMHYSQEWDNAGMPHAIFFTTRGHSIHGSDHPGLGTPVSHGCVRLSLTNATTLYDLVTAEGMGKTTVIVRGDDPPGYYTPSQPPQQKRPFGASNSFSIHAAYRFSVFRVQASRSGHTLFAARGFAGCLRCTAMSRVTSLHSGEALARVSSPASCPPLARRFRRTRNRAGRRAAGPIWPRPFRPARSGQARRPPASLP